jgi:hypothetical protein
MNDETLLLTHARRYFRAAAECQDLRKMEVLVDLGLDYLKLAARRNRPGVLNSARPRDPPTHEASAGPLLKSAVAQRAKAESGDPGAANSGACGPGFPRARE